MADINLDKGKTMLLMADFSTSGIGQNPIAKERQTLERARDVLDAARKAGVFVGYCISHFRPGFPEVSDRNTTRAAHPPVRAAPSGGAGHRQAPHQRLLRECL